MIRADLANRLQPAADLALRPALPAREISDKLSGFVAGQRLLAEIQSLLPNGSYRALINQRSMTLALPFAAKTGDAIELEVQESDGKLTLAVVSRAASESGKEGAEAAATRLSRTGQLISNLFAGARDARGGPLPLNGNQPIAANPPTGAQDLLPLLKQAISESGMFYESHQAEWVEGRYSKAQLLQEPQGKLAPQTPAQAVASPAGDTASLTRTAVDAAQVLAKPAEMNTSASPAAQLAQVVSPQTQVLVQQQLEAFATQNFSWQGQVWPGQQIEWEIENESKRHQTADRAENEKWQTRLRLTLPQLGEVDARLHIQGKQLMLTMIASDTRTRELLRSEVTQLQSQFEQAGLDLASLAIAAPTENQAHAQRTG
jgi:hypothetical protein